MIFKKVDVTVNIFEMLPKGSEESQFYMFYAWKGIFADRAVPDFYPDFSNK